MKKELKKELDNAINTSGIVLKWNPDPKGYFIIKPIPPKKIFVRHYDLKNILKHTFVGTITLQIIQSIIKKKLISRLDHAAYLGKEIEKAVMALKNNFNYIQDKEIELKNKKLIKIY